jgi:hypothetical protein
MSEHIGMCLFYLEEIQNLEKKISNATNANTKNQLITQQETLYERLSINQETLPDLDWFESIDLNCSSKLFFETLVNNIKNMVLKIQNNIYKAKNARTTTVKTELELLKKNYVANQVQIFKLKKELSNILESELKSELHLIKGFEHMNDEKITPHFLQMAKNLQKNPYLEIIEVPVEERLTGDVGLDRTNYILKFSGDLYGVPVGSSALTDNSIPEFLDRAAHSPEILNAKLTPEERDNLEVPVRIEEFDIAVKKN